MEVQPSLGLITRATLRVETETSLIQRVFPSVTGRRMARVSHWSHRNLPSVAGCAAALLVRSWRRNASKRQNPRQRSPPGLGVTTQGARFGLPDQHGCGSGKAGSIHNSCIVNGHQDFACTLPLFQHTAGSSTRFRNSTQPSEQVPFNFPLFVCSNHDSPVRCSLIDGPWCESGVAGTWSLWHGS